MTKNNELRLPWKLRDSGLGIIVVAEDGSTVNTEAQKRYCVEAANALPRMTAKLQLVEEAYVRMCHNAGSTESAGTILGRLYESLPADMQMQPVCGDLTPDPALHTPEADKTAPDPGNGGNRDHDEVVVVNKSGINADINFGDQPTDVANAVPCPGPNEEGKWPS